MCNPFNRIMGCDSCSVHTGKSITTTSIDQRVIDDIHSANTSRKVAMKEILLLERHHLAVPDARCLDDCEPAHQLTASAAMLEASRMSDGDDTDKELASAIESINLNDDARSVQQQFRAVRKQIQGKTIFNSSDVNVKHEGFVPSSASNKNTVLKLLGFAAGSFLVAEGIISIVKSQDQRPISQVGRGIRIGLGAIILIASLRK